MRCVAIALLATMPIAGAWAQRDFSGVEIQTVEVADGFYMLRGAGGNLGLSVGEDGAFLVDDQFAPLSQKIQAAIAELTDGDVKFVLNTHWHEDHTGGNENFGDAGAVIIAHDNVRVRMGQEQAFEILERNYPPSPPGALPVVTFSDEITFHWNDDTIHAFHVDPAHTDGDVVLYFENANVFHMGDTFFYHAYPFIDVGSGGEIDGIIAAGYRVLAMSNADSRIIPGHGDLAGVEDLEMYLRVLRVARGRVQRLIDRGMSEDEVVAARPTAEFDEGWGGGFMNPENFNRLLYQSLIR